ncbi:MAG: hypothetical protein WBF93_16870 [Pirellulales bacterium]
MTNNGATNDVAETATEQRICRETAQKIADLCCDLYPKNQIHDERRNENRYPFPYLVTISPVESDGLTPLAQPFSVVAKQISEGGIGFYYNEPMPYRYVVVSLPELRKRPALHLLVDLTRCHLARPGWYENGGVFVMEVDEPALVSILESSGSSPST